MMWRGSKYRNQPNRCCEGIMHQSTLESARCTELHVMSRAGLIRDLQAHPQVRLPCLGVKGEPACHYLADFRYTDSETGEVIYEDTKGIKTDIYRIKAALLKQQGIEIQEVRRVRGRRR